MTLDERIAMVDAKAPVEPTTEELKAIEDYEGNSESVSVSDLMQSLEGYSGKFVIRLPRTLHKRLKLEAEAEGISLNQYVLYKLAR